MGAVYDYARSHREKFAKQFNGSFIKRYEIGYDALIEAMNQINFEKKDHWPLHR